MPKKRFGAEQILKKLRQVEVLQSLARCVAASCKEAGLSDSSAFETNRVT